MLSPAPAPIAEGLKERLYDLAASLDVYRKGFDTARDSRAVFAYAYVLITRHLADALDKAGFNDPAWIVQLAETFAAKYLDALRATTNAQLAPAWNVVFTAIRDKRTTVLEDLLLAISAHLIHDLPLALVQVGLHDSVNASRISDFHRVNDLLATNIQKITDAVTGRYEPFFRWLDHLEEKNAQVLTDYGFRVSRGLAWYNAERLLEPAAKVKAEQAINKSVEIIVDDVLRPPVWSLRILLRGLRWFVALFRRWPDPNR